MAKGHYIIGVLIRWYSQGWSDMSVTEDPNSETKEFLVIAARPHPEI